MFEITVHVPTQAHGDLSVQAEVEKRERGGSHYHIGTVRDALGRTVECSLDLLEEIEMSIVFEMQCARYDALYFAVDTPELLAYHA